MTHDRRSIEETPDEYDQMTYGTGYISLGNAGNASLATSLPASPSCGKSCGDASRASTWEDDAAEEIAKAMRFPHRVADRLARTLASVGGPEWRKHRETFVPMPTDAVAVLDGILNGRIEHVGFDERRLVRSHREE